MTKIAIPPDLAGMFTACEDAYEQATQEGYPENPAVVAAIADLKSAWKALHVANYNLMTAKGFFAAEFATVCTERACRATTEACIKLHAAIGLAALEHRLDNRCLTLASQSATPRLTKAAGSGRLVGITLGTRHPTRGHLGQ